MFIDDHRRAEMKARGQHLNVSLPTISRSSVRNYRLQFAPDRFTAASIKNPTRIRALAEIHNAVTCAALASQLQDVPPETFVSMDAVGVRLGDRMDDKPFVYLANGSRAALLDRNLLPATSKTMDQFRVVNCIVAHNAAGHVVHCAVMIKDDTITACQVSSITDTLSE